jgi:gluconolactonase
MALATSTPAAPLPGPPELMPGRPDAIVDLQSAAGLELASGQWRYCDARVEEVDFVAVGHPDDPLGPGVAPNRTFDVLPHAQAADYDDSGWRVLAPEETRLRLAAGRVCFNWYRIHVTVPERVGELDPTGATIVFEVVIDDYAEVWVDGSMPIALGEGGGRVVGGFNAPNRVILTRDAQPGQSFQIAVFGINGPISASPRNYIWMRTASLDFYAAERASSAERVDDRTERVAGGFEFTEGPLWSAADAALLFSSPNTNAIYRYDPGDERVTVFRSKSGYSGVDAGRYHQPGSNGLAFSPDGLLTLCQHGNRRVLRVNPHGDTTVLCDSYEGKRLNSPNDLVYRSDGTLYFTDPAFGLPGLLEDPAKELAFQGVFAVRPDGVVLLVDNSLAGPNGIAFSPDERRLYVGDWDDAHKAVMRYPIAGDGSPAGPGELLCDLTDEPGEDAIDGIEVHSDGRLFVCGPGGIWVLSAEGEKLELIELPEAPHNLTWGPDETTLYVTALTSIYRLRLEETR